nr:selenide, water dikinase SelD [uncultured Mediterraneibacter sp.]
MSQETKKIRLTKMTKTAGCAAKIGPGVLAQVLGTLPKFEDENLLVGIETSDDAAIYKLNEEQAMIQTVDFFTPMVDDPYLFGQVAATNALSDVYAMGGDPKVALNIVAFPNDLDPEILGEILRGGADKVKEAGAVLVGGHSIQDDEPKYGMCVSGLVHPDHILKNCGCHPEDVLILTKQLGAGILNTAVKAELASEQAQREVLQVMTSLNKTAAHVIRNYPVTACTDVTGFGLMGHCSEMAVGSDVTLELYKDRIPLMGEVREYAKIGLVPGGAYRNREYVGAAVDLGDTPEDLADVFFDPQTSGGLLFAVSPEYAEKILKELEENGLNTKAAVIGKVLEKGAYRIQIR